jgi:tetratricopeptide (TPR) repeat protein
MTRARQEPMMDERGGLLTRFRRGINAGAVAAVFAAIALLCLTRATDPDLHWHLAAGRLIRTTGAVPRADPFSYTAYGLPWVDVQWLFQVAASFLFDAGGFAAITVAAAFLITGLFAFLYLRALRIAGAVGSEVAASGGKRGAAATGCAAALLLAALAAQERFLTRPEIVSWWLLALVLAGLDAVTGTGSAARRRVVLWAGLPIVVLLWVNVQSLFILGPAMTALALVAALARAALPGGPRSPALGEAGDLLVSLALQSAVALVNPHGARAVRLPFEQFFDHLGGSTLLAMNIAEFRPTLSGYLYTPAIGAFVVLAVITAIALAANLRRARALDLLVAGATLFLALRARRNIPIFAIAAVPILVRGAAEAVAAARARFATGRPSGSRHRTALLAPAALALAAVALGAGVVTDRFYLLVPTERWFGVGPIPYYFPDESAAFVAGASLPGQVFHPLAVGGFLVRAWEGDRRVFIDGRNDPFLHGVFETYLRTVADPEAFEATAQRYQITAVLWPHQRAIEGRNLLRWLAGGHGWVLAHVDAGAAVYVRQDVLTPGTPAAESAAGLPAGLAGFLRQRLAAEPFAGPPIREIALADFFSITGDPADAESFLRPAIEALPRSALLRYKLGLALEGQGRRADARAAYAEAAGLDPSLATAEGALGSLALDDGDLDEAQRRLERAWKGGERGARILADRAHLLEKRGLVREAGAAWQEAIGLLPGNTDLLLGAARFQARSGSVDAARDLYDQVLRRDPAGAIAAFERALLLDQAGRSSEALAGLVGAADAAAARLGDASQAGVGAGRTAAAAADRRLVELAVRLARQAGAAERAASWSAALAGR